MIIQDNDFNFMIESQNHMLINISSKEWKYQIKELAAEATQIVSAKCHHHHLPFLHQHFLPATKAHRPPKH